MSGRKFAKQLASFFFFVAVSAGNASLARAACKIQSAEVPVVVTRNRILMPAEIGGRKVFFIYDTGAAYSMLRAGADRFLGMGTRENRGLTVYGAGGSVHARSVLFADLQLGQFHLRNQEMLIADQLPRQMPSSDPIIGLIGSDIFGGVDVEFDLAHKVVRLLKPSGCDDDDMVYWGDAYSKSPIIWRSEGQHVDLDLGLNGQTVEAILDTGSPFSIVTLAAAARAGVTPDSPGSHQAGMVGGIGPAANPAWVGEFKSVTIGNEKISGAKLMVADLFHQSTYYELGSRLSKPVASTQMLLGLDFVRSHRVLISRSHEKIYFSYNGGPVFERDQPTAVSGGASEPPLVGGAPLSSPSF